MNKGFTIIELLVASLLLGMLMTILTMIFSQSSIAWRTGMAGAEVVKKGCTGISDVRYVADNAYVWNNQPLCVRSVFDEKTGKIRTDRQIGDFDNDIPDDIKSGVSEASDNNGFQSDVRFDPNSIPDPFSDDKYTDPHDYIVNVMSCGPDRNDKTLYDNIYVLPTDPTTWRE